MTEETTPQPELADVEYSDEWLSTDRLIEIVEIASQCEDSNEAASHAINELAAENLILRNQVVISTGAFTSIAGVLDAVIYAADRTHNQQLISLLETLLRGAGLLAADEPLVKGKPGSGLIIPDTKTTKKITHKGRITEVS